MKVLIQTWIVALTMVSADAAVYKLTGCIDEPCSRLICPLGVRTIPFSASCVLIHIDKQKYGTFLTAGHVMKEPGRNFKVQINNHSYGLMLLKKFPNLELGDESVAVLRSSEPLPASAFCVKHPPRGPPRVGESVKIYGFPRGKSGVIDTSIKGITQYLIITQMKPVVGASGGALVNARKELIGIVSGYDATGGFMLPLTTVWKQVILLIPELTDAPLFTPKEKPHDQNAVVPIIDLPKKKVPYEGVPGKTPDNLPEVPPKKSHPEKGTPGKEVSVLSRINGVVHKIPWETITGVAITAATAAAGGGTVFAGYKGLKYLGVLMGILGRKKPGPTDVAETAKDAAQAIPSVIENVIKPATENRYITKEVDHIGEAYKEAVRRTSAVSGPGATTVLKQVEHTAKELLRGRTVATRVPDQPRPGLWTDEEQQ